MINLALTEPNEQVVYGLFLFFCSITTLILLSKGISEAPASEKNLIKNKPVTPSPAF